MARKNLIIWLAAVMVLAGGCGKAPVPTLVATTLTPACPVCPTCMPTLTPLPPTKTFTPQPSLTPTVTSTPTIPPEVLRYQCLEIADHPPANHNSTGILISSLDNNTGAFAYDITTSYTYTFPMDSGDRLHGFLVSPDGNLIMYYHVRLSSEEIGSYIESLVIATSHAEPVWSQDITESWAVWDWINNENILGNRIPDYGWLINLIFLNPFTGERREFQPDYPGFAPVDMLSELRWFSGSAKYDPTLTRVLYPECDEECIGRIIHGETAYPVALWDIEHSQVLARFVTRDHFGSTPIWSTDGQQVVMAANGNPTGEYSPSNEFYSISRDGEIRQLTHFMDYFEQVEIINSYSLSPDGSTVAFWIIAQPGPFEGERLAVLDIATGQVTNYCLLGGPVMDYYSPISLSSPIWSPDSKQLLTVIRNPQDSSRIQTIMVDINRSYAAKIADDTIPVGWMVAP